MDHSCYSKATFFWRCLHNALLVYADLVSRHLVVVPTCSMYHSQSETLDIYFSFVILLELYDLLVFTIIKDTPITTFPNML